jgi:membrane-associated protein
MSELFDGLLHSFWLLPVLVSMIALDGPVPLLPSEPLLMAAASAEGDVPGTPVLFVTAMTGSILGDSAVYALGRVSHAVVGKASNDSGLGAWVGSKLRSRPILVCVSVRLVPGGRLVSTAACGRLRIPFRVFLMASLVSSALWSGYLLAVGVVLAPLTHGDPVLSLVAGLLLGVITAASFWVGRRLLRLRKGATNTPRPGDSTDAPEPAA